jgi:hypothetical protein
MEPSKADLSQVIKRGESNELIVNASNQGGTAALVARITLKLPSGRQDIVIESNGTWEVAKAGTQEFKKALVIGVFGNGPWGKPFAGKIGSGGGKNSGPAESIAAADITVPKGFKVEKLYNVPKDQEGSWVALTVDPKGRLIACDQYGSIYRMSVPAIGKTENLKPEKLAIEMGKAHGLLHAHGALYVMVNENGANNGLYRLTDTNADDQYDKIDKLVTMEGGGEHGHADARVDHGGEDVVGIERIVGHGDSGFYLPPLHPPPLPPLLPPREVGM